MATSLAAASAAEPPRTEQVAQGRAGDEIADEDGQPVEIRDLVDGDDPRMPELGGRPRLPVEPRDILGGFDQVGVRDLEGDDPVQPNVERTPDSPKTAYTDLLEELELAERPGLTVLGRG